MELLVSYLRETRLNKVETTNPEVCMILLIMWHNHLISHLYLQISRLPMIFLNYTSTSNCCNICLEITSVT